MKVFILVRHDPTQDIFGSIAVFKTLRVGFPTAEIIVDYNGPCYEVRKYIDDKILNISPVSTRYLDSVEHYDWIQSIVNTSDGPIVFCDTDMIFYENVETNLEPLQEYRNLLIAGRKIPQYYNITIGATEASRLHTSLLYINSCENLRQHIATTHNTGLHPFNPFAPFQYYSDEGQLRFYDTCANLYHSIGIKYAQFGEYILDKYTHLVSGTMLTHVAKLLPNGERLIEHHKMAQKDPESVRGLWREHDKFYQHYKI